MKIDILDTAMNPKGISYFDLKKEINYLQDEKGAQIKDIKHISTYPDGRNYVVAILYEEQSIIQQKTFDEFSEDDEVNEFLKSHDVIQVDHLPDCNTVVTYRKSVNNG